MNYRVLPSLHHSEGAVGAADETSECYKTWCNKLVDMQKQYKIISNGQEKDSVVDLAETIIDP